MATEAIYIVIKIMHCLPGPSTKANCHWHTGPKIYKYGDQSECLCWMLALKSNKTRPPCPHPTYTYTAAAKFKLCLLLYIYIYSVEFYIKTSWLPGFARDPPSLPSLIGLPGFEQNISSVIAQNNSIPEIRFKH